MLTKKKIAMCFAVLFIHITLLDLFLLTRRGPRFLWAESFELKTFSVHLGITLISCFVLVGLWMVNEKRMLSKQKTSRKQAENKQKTSRKQAENKRKITNLTNNDNDKSHEF
ncbi:hypothetical protein [Thalassotalea sp. ND16A]|uniref:hypothetical protein n=1 Tax=Thalassotalea sp. ND16A TaxID=1535422 RepID=UPI00051A49E1|nr:hypothetical protein [Thalassotalea sp. ND16A]KGJ87895.1 hypothetical protein ND16A_2809 [Thalassotalea sp. ND16A]